MAPIPTLRVRRFEHGDEVVINASDFDPAKHALAAEPAAASVRSAQPAAVAKSAKAADSPSAPADGPNEDVEPVALREDGPTVEEFVTSGYPAHAYPPLGYAEKSSPGLDALLAELAALVGGKADAAVEGVKTVTHERALARLERLERDGKGRSSVLNAIAEHRKHLTATT